MAVYKTKRKRKGIGYRVKVPLPNGKTASKVFDRKIDAEKWEAEVKLEPNRAGTRMKFREVTSKFLEVHLPDKEPSTQEKYEGAVRLYLNPEFGDWRINRISTLDIEQFRAKLVKLHRSDSTKAFIFTALKTIFKKATEWGFVGQNPARDIKPIKRGAPRTEYWQPREVAQFLHAMSSSPRLPIYLLALNTGMRAGELFGLKWESVDLENGIITVQRQFCHKSHRIRETTKGKRNREIGLNDILLTLLVDIQDVLPKVSSLSTQRAWGLVAPLTFVGSSNKTVGEQECVRFDSMTCDTPLPLASSEQMGTCVC